MHTGGVEKFLGRRRVLGMIRIRRCRKAGRRDLPLHDASILLIRQPTVLITLTHAPASSRRRRTVDLVAAAAGVDTM